jgi:tetraacyldisaccharide 4'-kinase
VPVPEHTLIERLWYGDGPGAGATRLLLAPAERVFSGIAGVRDMLYDAGWLPTHEPAIPAISIGNLTVGGTGKTPIAAWIARELAARGVNPSVVLRGYGDDEPRVHRTLNPNIPVVLGADRVEAIRRARELGADVAVLDDAFQHRRVRRVADFVLVSADRWTPAVRLLPAGPWREPLRAIRRATLIIVTRKVAADAAVDAVNKRLATVAPLVPRVTVALRPAQLVRATDESQRAPVTTLSGTSVRMVASIADPGSFQAQLERLGARVDPFVFRDHHAFSAADVAAVTSGLGANDRVVCTLKDAVKLAPRWPRLGGGPALWYVSQLVMVERGVGGLEHILDDLVRTRFKTPPTAG